MDAGQIMALQAGVATDRLVATLAMRWHAVESGPDSPYWHDAAGRRAEQRLDTDDYYHPRSAWSPSTCRDEALQAGIGVAGRHEGLRVEMKRRQNARDDEMAWEYTAQVIGTRAPAFADTLEMAVCRAVLLASLGE